MNSNIRKAIRCLAVCMVLMISCSACGAARGEAPPSEPPGTEAAHRLHRTSDFYWVILGVTTSSELYERLGAADTAYATGYGTLLEYSLEDGSHLYVRCYGPDMTVRRMEINDPDELGLQKAGFSQ